MLQKEISIKKEKQNNINIAALQSVEVGILITWCFKKDNLGLCPSYAGRELTADAIFYFFTTASFLNKSHSREAQYLKHLSGAKQPN